jgi:methylase of polypeptide subunit release factors
MLTSFQPLKDVFFCPEESNFYSHCLETLVLKNCFNSESIIEFGSGDGSPVINSLLRAKFNGIIHGFELNNLACEAANAKIAEYKLSDRYIVYNRSFFDSRRPAASFLVSNPPYLPALDNKIYQPLLYGGTEGITVTKQLLSLNYKNVLVMVSSYSNPGGLIDYALAKDYYVSDFIVSPLKFGYYSSEPKVRDRITELRKINQAFYSKNIYLLAGILFTKKCDSTIDLSTELLQLMTCL